MGGANPNPSGRFSSPVPVLSSRHGKQSDKGRPRIETGFVGFFDILGYKSALESGITDVTFKVIDILDGLPQRVEKALNEHMGDYFSRDNPAACDLRWALERVKTLIVSDSILLRSSYEEVSVCGQNQPGSCG